MYVGSNAFIEAYWHSDFLGKGIYLGLVALSVLSWALIVYKTWVARTVRTRSQEFETVFQANRQIPLNIPFTPVGVTSEMPNAYYEIYQVLKRHAVEILKKNQAARQTDKATYLSQTDIQLVESHLRTGISQQLQLLEEHIFLLATAASLGPLLGLLGTVWGILITFSELQTGASAMGSAMVLSGLAMALTTTVLGLLVAIPALVGYSTLRNRVNVFATEMEDFSAEMLGALELHYRRVDP